MSKVVDWAGEHLYRNDARGRQTHERHVLAGAQYDIQRGYDSMDRLTSLTYPDGEVLSYFYDQQGLNNSVQSSLGPGYLAPSSTAFNAAGQPLSLKLGNNRVLSFGYRPADLRLISLGVSQDLLNLSYTYDQKGNIQSITDSLITQSGVPPTSTFGYDDSDRLISVAGPQSSTFQYDKIGNLTRKDEGLTQGAARENASQCQNASDDDLDQAINDGCTTSYSTLCYSPQFTGCTGVASGRPHAVKTAAGTDGQHAFSYDESGNMTRETLNGADLRVFEYDAEGRLSRAQLETGAPFNYYHYDAGGQLMRKTTDPGQTGTVYVGGVFEKNTGTGEVTKYYFTAGARRIAMRKADTDPQTPDIVYYLANDHLDGTALVMDSSGGMVSRPRYYPYGMQWTQEGSAPPTDRLFTGQQRQGPNSGIYYYGARFYGADVGRFAEADTEAPLLLNDVPCARRSSAREGILTNGQVIERTDPPALNRYSYVINNPINYVDPTGEFVWSTFGWENPAQWGLELDFDFGVTQPPSCLPHCTPTPTPNPTPTPSICPNPPKSCPQPPTCKFDADGYRKCTGKCSPDCAVIPNGRDCLCCLHLCKCLFCVKLENPDNPLE